jgi:hypothetical protein
VPQSYTSMGEAIAAAMQHNIRLAYGDPLPVPDTSLPVRALLNPSADPHSVPGMIARLTETATPSEVAGIVKEVNGTLAGALPQLTELVAAAADWTRVRLEFDDPHPNAPLEIWTRLAAAHGMLQDVQEQLDIARDGIAACPAGLTDPRHHKAVNVLRTRELLSDALGTDVVTAAVPPVGRDPKVNRQRAARAARAASPQATAQRTTPSAITSEIPAGPPPLGAPRTR